MNEQILSNIYGFLKGEELVTSEFDDWKNNFQLMMKFKLTYIIIYNKKVS